MSYHDQQVLSALISIIMFLGFFSGFFLYTILRLLVFSRFTFWLYDEFMFKRFIFKTNKTKQKSKSKLTIVD